MSYLLKDSQKESRIRNPKQVGFGWVNLTKGGSSLRVEGLRRFRSSGDLVSSWCYKAGSIITTICNGLYNSTRSTHTTKPPREKMPEAKVREFAACMRS